MERLRPVSFLTLPKRLAVGAVLFVTAVLAVGCSDRGEPLRSGTTSPPPAAVCELRPTALDLGSVAVGTSRDTSFHIVNAGNAPLAADIAAGCASLQVLAGAGAHVIAPHDSLVVTIRFTASASGPAGCSVTTGLACASVDVSANGFVPVTVFFATDIQPIFNANCTTIGCHSGVEPEANLSLVSARAYAQLVDVPSFGYDPAVRVVPGHPETSVLYGKVTGDPNYGTQMPQGGNPLTNTQRQKIRTWILEGARNN